MNNQQYYDVLIVGSGAAGLTLALSLPDNLDVAVLSKTSIEENATFYAQGGISAVVDDKDSVEAHMEDTIKAGHGLCRQEAVRFIVERGRERVDWLSSKGVSFSKRKSKSGRQELHLSQEGGHSARRVVHAADKTGEAIETALVKKFRNSKVTLLENHIAIDLICSSNDKKKSNRCDGVFVLDKKSNSIKSIGSKITVLATGGAGKVYLYTSNPDVSTGDGIAMAWRAGCSIANMEFVQFHPTCLYHPNAKSMLLTEALRGEGGILTLPSGERFAHHYHPMAELAPRDTVAKAIDTEMKKKGCDYIYLDISHKSGSFIKTHFPNAYQNCLRFGFDISREPIPIVPAAHYFCGGIVTDLDGRTSIERLYAIGETACTGLHGANRMASNSLLECLVLAESSAESITTTLAHSSGQFNIPEWDESRVVESDEDIMVSHNWDELRRIMWNYVGIVRSSSRLAKAQKRVELLKDEVSEFYGNYKMKSDLIELRNLVQIADLIIKSATMRKESRGLHYTLDYPSMNEEYSSDTVLSLRRVS